MTKRSRILFMLGLGLSMLSAPWAQAQAQSLPSAKISCLPEVPPFFAATGKGMVVRTDGWGESRAWWCPTEIGWNIQWATMLHEYRANTNLIPRLRDVLLAPNPVDAAWVLLDKYKAAPAASSLNAFNTLTNQAIAAAQSTRPADPTWTTTAVNSQAYTYTNNAFVTPAVGTAPVGVPCTCTSLTVKTLEGTRWCSWQGGPEDQVATCVRQ